MLKNSYELRFCPGDFSFAVKRAIAEKVLGKGMARPIKGVTVLPAGWVGSTWRELIAEAEQVLHDYPNTPYGEKVDHIHLPEGGDVVHLGILPEGLVQSGFPEPISLDEIVVAEGEISLDVCHQEEG